MTTIRRLATLLFSLALLATACATNAAEETVADGSSDPIAADTAEKAAEAGASEAMSEDGASQAASEPEQATTSSDQAPNLAAVDGSTLKSSLLARTLDQPADVSSARFEGRFSFVGAPGSEAPGEFSLTFSGAYDRAAQASDITIDFGDFIEAAAGSAAAQEGEQSDDWALFSGFFADPIRIIAIGDTAWTNWSFITAFLGPDQAGDGDLWIEGSAQDGLDPTAEFGFAGVGEPREFMEMIQDGKATIEELGSDELRGVNTTHYRAIVDGESLRASMTDEERAEFESQFGSGGASLPMEFWLDDDGLVRKFLIDLSEPGMIEDEDLLSAEVVFEMFDLGQPMGIEPPPADKILTEDELGFNFGDS